MARRRGVTFSLYRQTGPVEWCGRPLAVGFRSRFRRLQLAARPEGGGNCFLRLPGDAPALAARLSVSNPPAGALLIPLGPNRDRSPRLPPACARAPADGERLPLRRAPAANRGRRARWGCDRLAPSSRFHWRCRSSPHPRAAVSDTTEHQRERPPSEPRSPREFAVDCCDSRSSRPVARLPALSNAYRSLAPAAQRPRNKHRCYSDRRQVQPLVKHLGPRSSRRHGPVRFVHSESWNSRTLARKSLHRRSWLPHAPIRRTQGSGRRPGRD